MSKTAIILLHKTGDIVGFLPVARHIFLTTGEKPTWYVSLHYAQVFLATTYVQPVKVQFAMDRSDLAVILAKEAGATRIINGQTFGKWYKGPTNAAFNRLAWNVNGFGESFDDKIGFPLIFDRRDADREDRLCRRTLNGNKPVLLLSLACGRSSPFPPHHIVTESVQRKWSNRFQIVNLCSARASRIYDVIALLERASLLITSDSVFAHLATATPHLPVILLHNDQPFLATSPRCNCILKLPYSQWHSRIKEIHATIAKLAG